jgi:dinuclear metal center YbgI/SA1388 family protein
MTIREISSFLESWAPLGTAEEYDNAGLLTGRPDAPASRILVSLDATEEVVQEAMDKKCNLLISHHPILFKGLKKLAGQNYAARAVEKAIRNDIALYAIHTNLDNADTGVNKILAEKLGLKTESLKILRPLVQRLIKLSYFVPIENHEEVLKAVHAAGGGQIGKYYDCSFSVEGRGRFTPGEGCNPALGKIGVPEQILEYKVDIIVPDVQFHSLLSALKKAHPYEELAYFASPVLNQWQDKGAGMVGELPEEMNLGDFVAMVKNRLDLRMLKHTRPTKERVKKIALCGGSGVFLLSDAKAAGADVYLTSDVKYHEFFDAEDRLVLMDAGHYETEQFTSEGIVRKLSAQFPNIAVLLSETKTNPVYYA